MKSVKYLILTLSLIVLTFIACSKEEDHHSTEATLTITSPHDGHSFKSGDAITVTAVATAEEDLHGYQVTATKVADGTEIFKKEEHAHGTSLNIDESFVNTASAGQDIKIKVTVVLDHDQNTIEKEVTIKTN